MKIGIELIGKAFVFISDFSIKREDGVKSVDLTGRDDAFIKTLIYNLSCGILKSDTDYRDLISYISDDELRDSTAAALGVKDKVSAKIIDETVVEPEILELEVEPETEVVSEEASEIDVESLQALLKGTNKSVSNKVKNAELSDEEKAVLLSLEEEGKNRATIKALIA